MEFSVENRAILNAREKRMEKSREMNPTWKNSKKAQKKNTEGKWMRMKTMIEIVMFF